MTCKNSLEFLENRARIKVSHCHAILGESVRAMKYYECCLLKKGKKIRYKEQYFMENMTTTNVYHVTVS
jgi:hypothetical protein